MPSCTSYNRILESEGMVDAVDFYEVWYERGHALHNLQQYEDAIASYDKAIELNPNYHQAWSARGLTFKTMERYTEAKLNWSKALELAEKVLESNRGDHEAMMTTSIARACLQAWEVFHSGEE